eukprot:scpid30455/ scgid10075/ 
MEGSLQAAVGNVLTLSPCHLWRTLLIKLMCDKADEENQDGGDEIPHKLALYIADKVDLYLLQCLEDNPETTLDQMLCDLETIGFPPLYISQLCERCCSFLEGTGDIGALHLIVAELTGLMTPQGSNQPPLLHPLSMCGVYVREVLESFRSLPFEHVCELTMRCQDEVKQSHHPAVIRCQRSCYQPSVADRFPNSSDRQRHSVLVGSSPVFVHREEGGEFPSFHIASPSRDAPPSRAQAASSSTPINSRTDSSFNSDASLSAIGKHQPSAGTSFQADSSLSAVEMQPLSVEKHLAFTETPPVRNTRHMVGLTMSSSHLCRPDTLNPLSTDKLMVKSRLSLADVDPEVSAAAALESAIAFSLPPLDNPTVFARKLTHDARDAQVQKVMDDLTSAQQRRDWSDTVKLHHKLFDMTLPRSSASALDSSNERRSDARNAMLHCGLAIRELSCSAAAIGCRHEAAMLRNKAVQLALVTDDRDSQFWALSDVLASIHPSSKEVDVFSQQLQTKADEVASAVPREPCGHMSHLWRAWHALYHCNQPMHVMLDEWTQGWSMLLEEQQFQAVPQFLSFLAWSYFIFGYSSCSQVLSQMLMMMTLKAKTPYSSVLKPTEKTALENIDHVRRVVSQLVACCMQQGDYCAALKVLHYDDMCEQLSPTPVAQSKPLSVQRCEVWIETSLLQCNWETARRWIDALRAHHDCLSRFYEAKLLHELSDTAQASCILKQLIADLEQSFSRVEEFDVNFTPLLLARSLLLHGQVLSCRSLESCQVEQLLTKCLSLCKVFNLTSDYHSTLLALTEYQLSSGKISVAHQTLMPWIPRILACSPQLDQGKALLLFARILLNDRPTLGKGEAVTANVDLKEALRLLEASESRLKTCHAHKLLSQVYQWKCRVCQALGDRAASLLAAKSYSAMQSKVA